MNDLLAVAAVESIVWTTLLAYRFWVMGALVLFLIYRNFGLLKSAGGGLASRMAAMRTTGGTEPPDDVAALQAFGVLKVKLKGSPEAVKALKALWPFLEPGEGE